MRRSEKKKREKKQDSGARKGKKVAIHYVFPMICGSGGSKSRLAKAAGAEPSGQMRDKQFYAVVARSTFESKKAQSTSRSDRFCKLRRRKSARRSGAKLVSKSKCTKHTNSRTTFGSFGVEKVHAAHFQVKMYKAHHSRTTFGSCDVEKCMPLWREAHFQVKMYKVAMSKKCTPLWREAHFQVKMLKTPHARTTFGG